MKLASEGNGFTMWEPPFRGSSWLAYKINPKAPEKDFAVRLMGPVELVSYLRLQDGRKLHAPSAVASAGPGAVDYFFHKSEIPRVTLNLKYRRNPKDIVVFLGK